MDIFRKSSLEKLSSPEQLDTMMTVTSPRGWIALLGIGAVLFYVLLWSIFGEIPDKVAGSGIMIRGGAIFDVVAVGTGRVTEIKVKPGDVVTAGEVVAAVSSPELQLRVSNIRKQLDVLTSEDQEMTTSDDHNLELERGALETQRENLRSAKQDSIKMMGFLEQKVATQEMLLDKGALTRTNLLSTRNELISAQQDIARCDLQISQANTSESTAMAGAQERKLARHAAEEDVRRQLSETEGELQLTTNVISPYTGRVLELMVDRGNIVQAGTRVVSLEDLNASLRAVIFIPAGDGKKVREGMEVRISPATVKREEYGSLVGRVESVAEFPSTEEGVNRTLRNELLAATLMGSGSVIEIFATLELDPSTVSGFKWSSSHGPPLKVASGTLASAEIVVGSRHPITIFIPYLRKKTGVY